MSPKPYTIHETNAFDRSPNNHVIHLFRPDGGYALATHYFQYHSDSEPYEDFDDVRTKFNLMADALTKLELV